MDCAFGILKIGLKTVILKNEKLIYDWENMNATLKKNGFEILIFENEYLIKDILFGKLKESDFFEFINFEEFF